MKNPFAGLFNRAPSTTASTDTTRESVNGVASAPVSNPQDRIGDPLCSLTPYTIDVDYRQRINRGEYTYPAWALYNAEKLFPVLGDKFSFWSASLSGLDYDILISDETKDNPTLKAKAEKQKVVLKEKYSAENMANVFRHLSLAKFYGYSAMSRKTPLEPLDWWNVLRDGLHGAFYWNPECRSTLARSMPADSIMRPEEYIIRQCQDSILLHCLRAYQRTKDVESWWDKNLEQESRRQVIVLTGTPDAKKAPAYETAARNISEGRSGYIAKGPADAATEIIFPPASRGIQFYETRLRKIDEELTKLLTGGLLTMLTAPGSGTLAGNAHSDTLTTIIAAEASAISETLQEQFDRPALIEAGLLLPGEQPLAYFAMRTTKATDPANEVQWTAQLAAAGWQRDGAELSERMKMKLIPATVNTVPAQPIFGASPDKPASDKSKPSTTTNIPVDNVASATLNGEQLTSLVGILTAAASGQMPIGSVNPIITAAFPSISAETVKAITGPLQGFTPTVSSGGAAVANRVTPEPASGQVTIPPEWMEPLREKLAELEKKMIDAAPEDAAKIVKDFVDGIPALFPELDTDALAETIAAEMSKSIKG